jgi:hypothetical protein
MASIYSLYTGLKSRILVNEFQIILCYSSRRFYQQLSPLVAGKMIHTTNYVFSNSDGPRSASPTQRMLNAYSLLRNEFRRSVVIVNIQTRSDLGKIFFKKDLGFHFYNNFKMNILNLCETSSVTLF